MLDALDVRCTCACLEQDVQSRELHCPAGGKVYLRSRDRAGARISSISPMPSILKAYQRADELEPFVVPRYGTSAGGSLLLSAATDGRHSTAVNRAVGLLTQPDVFAGVA